MGIVLYQLGLSFRKTARVLGFLGRKVSHVAVWYWKGKAAEAGPKFFGDGPLLPVIVADGTWVKVGGKDIWVFVALDPRTPKVTYLEPFFVRNETTADLFLEYLAEAYGEWPKRVITDGGPWYRAAFSFWDWEIEEKIRWKAIKGGVRSVIEGSQGVPQAQDRGFRPVFPREGPKELEKLALVLRFPP